MRKIALLAPALLLALVACGQAVPTASQPPAATSAAQSATQPAATTAPTEAPAPTSAPAPTAEPAGSPAPGGSGASIRPPEALVETAQQRLAQHLGVPEDKLMLQSANRREWPDSALGCPQADQAYLQVVTPGYELMFSDASQSQTYAVHTGEDGDQMVLCEDNQPTNLAEASAGAPQASASPAPSGVVAPDAASRALVDQARQALAQEIVDDAGAVKLQRVEPTEWRDSSLGCPQPGMNYLQVITPGYLIVLEAQGRSYEYHTDRQTRVIRCDRSPAGASPGAADTSPLANTSWKLESFGDPSAPTAALAESQITLMFDGAKQAISGNSGCNSYGGSYQVDGAKLTLSEIVSTLMACASQRRACQEAQFQGALRSVSQYTIDGERLELTYDGAKVLRFSSLP